MKKNPKYSISVIIAMAMACRWLRAFRPGNWRDGAASLKAFVGARIIDEQGKAADQKTPH